MYNWEAFCSVIRHGRSPSRWPFAQTRRTRLFSTEFCSLKFIGRSSLNISSYKSVMIFICRNAIKFQSASQVHLVKRVRKIFRWEQALLQVANVLFETIPKTLFTTDGLLCRVTLPAGTVAILTDGVGVAAINVSTTLFWQFALQHWYTSITIRTIKLCYRLKKIEFASIIAISFSQTLRVIIESDSYVRCCAHWSPHTRGKVKLIISIPLY
jgi:hypothetical protein